MSVVVSHGYRRAPRRVFRGYGVTAAARRRQAAQERAARERRSQDHEVFLKQPALVEQLYRPTADLPAVAAPARYIPSREIMAARRQTASGGRSSRKPGAGAAGCGFGSAFMRSY